MCPVTIAVLRGLKILGLSTSTNDIQATGAGPEAPLSDENDKPAGFRIGR